MKNFLFSFFLCHITTLYTHPHELTINNGLQEHVTLTVFISDKKYSTHTLKATESISFKTAATEVEIIAKAESSFVCFKRTYRFRKPELTLTFVHCTTSYGETLDAREHQALQATTQPADELRAILGENAARSRAQENRFCPCSLQ